MGQTVGSLYTVTQSDRRGSVTMLRRDFPHALGPTLPVERAPPAGSAEKQPLAPHTARLESSVQIQTRLNPVGIGQVHSPVTELGAQWQKDVPSADDFI
ncbi:hypothetical protein XENTR_v10013127 [Xenopus tropicalis]|nr:hypothetical protein XENTR_v10013127 [Xenopus tropicalis]